MIIEKYSELDKFWKDINESYENPESIRWIEKSNKLINKNYQNHKKVKKHQMKQKRSCQK